MKTFAAVAEAFSHWMDMVTSAFVPWFNRLGKRRIVRLTEGDRGEFILEGDEELLTIGSLPQSIRIVDGHIEQPSSAALASILPGSRVELVLQPDQFLFRQMELPDRAGEFIAGIVRAQIDRLTPWNAADTAFGWGSPVETGANRMNITVAATALTLVKPYVQAIASFEPHAIAVLTSDSEASPDSVPIKVFEERAREALDVRRVRHALVSILAVVGVITVVAIGLSTGIAAYLDARHDDVSRQISKARAQAGLGPGAGSGSLASALRTLEQRKNDAPANVMVLDAISRILPDHTYVTELRIEGQKLRVVGITRDAPSLIGLIEQSGRFTRATFFAPTTRSATDSEERFHIETVIQPLSGPQT